MNDPGALVVKLVVGSIIVLIGIGCSSVLATKPQWSEEGSLVLRHPKILLWATSVAGLGLPAFLLYTTINSEQPETFMIHLAVWMSVIIMAMATFGYVLIKRDFAVASATGITYHRAIRSSIAMPWQEISKVIYSEDGQSFTLYDHVGRKMKVSFYMQGILELCILMQEQLPADRLTGAQAGFDKANEARRIIEDAS